MINDVYNPKGKEDLALNLMPSKYGSLPGIAPLTDKLAKTN